MALASVVAGLPADIQAGCAGASGWPHHGRFGDENGVVSSLRRVRSPRRPVRRIGSRSPRPRVRWWSRSPVAALSEDSGPATPCRRVVSGSPLSVSPPWRRSGQQWVTLLRRIAPAQRSFRLRRSALSSSSPATIEPAGIAPSEAFGTAGGVGGCVEVDPARRHHARRSVRDRGGRWRG